jgi:hypothetical protein
MFSPAIAGGSLASQKKNAPLGGGTLAGHP